MKYLKCLIAVLLLAVLISKAEFTSFAVNTEFDTKEMSIFLDGVVSEAKDLVAQPVTGLRGENIAVHPLNTA